MINSNVKEINTTTNSALHSNSNKENKQNIENNSKCNNKNMYKN